MGDNLASHDEHLRLSQRAQEIASRKTSFSVRAEQESQAVLGIHMIA